MWRTASHKTLFFFSSPFFCFTLFLFFAAVRSDLLWFGGNFFRNPLAWRVYCVCYSLCLSVVCGQTVVKYLNSQNTFFFFGVFSSLSFFLSVSAMIAGPLFWWSAAFAVASICPQQVLAYYKMDTLAPATTPASTDFYGTSVATLNNIVVVGQPQCYFPYTTATSAMPAPTYRDFIYLFISVVCFNLRFVSVSVPVSTATGLVQIFSCTNTPTDYLCSPLQSITPSPSPTAKGCYGYSVALIPSSTYGMILLVGAPNNRYCFSFPFPGCSHVGL